MTVRTIQSPNNEHHGVITGEKETRPTRLTKLEQDAKMPESLQKTRDRTHKALEPSSSNREAKYSSLRKNFCSLKRNLVDEFNNISNADETPKKETVEEDSFAKEKQVDVKVTPKKEELKQSLLD